MIGNGNDDKTVTQINATQLGIISDMPASVFSYNWMKAKVVKFAPSISIDGIVLIPEHSFYFICL